MKGLSQQMAFPDQVVLVEDEKVRAQLTAAAKAYVKNHQAALAFGKANREIGKLLAFVDIDPETATTLAMSEEGPFIHVYSDTVDRAQSAAVTGAKRIRKEVTLERSAVTEE